MESRRNMLAMQRLIARSPRLKENPKIMDLSCRGHLLTREDVLKMCEELFLRPEYTVVIAGCFRHLLPQIVKGLVDALRESHAHRSVTQEFSELGESFISVTAWNLCVHEYAVIAFSRTLELAPPVLSSILEYFSFAPSPFERLVLYKLPDAVKKMRKSQPSLLDVARASYRFIRLEPASFEFLWDWSPLLGLLLFEGSEEKDVRWCAVQILALKMKLSDEATRSLSFNIACLTEKEAFSCLLRWEEFCVESSVEKAGWFVEPFTDTKISNFESKLLDQQDYNIKYNIDPSGTISCVDICGIQLPVRETMIKTSLPIIFKKSMLGSSNGKGYLKSLALALREQAPILLEGSAGSGKTTLIRELCELTGNTDAIVLHLSEQVDAKSLLGTYICTEIPGEFRWQPGAITQAMLQGLWLVLEDIDKAHSEVLSALIPLLESRQIYLPGRAETVKAAPCFQLFSTVTRIDTVSASRSAAMDALKSLWRRVVLISPNDCELGSIIRNLFPTLNPLVPTLIETLKLINAFASNALLPFDTASTRIYFGRLYSIKDLLKWCKRLTKTKEIGHDALSSSVREKIFTEAVDCFAACISDMKSRRIVVCKIAKLWGISEEQAHFYDMLNKPAIQVLTGAVQIGTAFLPTINNDCKEKRSYRPFAYTGHSLRNLERIARCVQHQEPVLLVGETGTGKTTLVQHLAEQVAVTLIVMNLSQQSDSADFMGGFKPIQVQQVCIKLLETFKELFNRTFPSQHNSDYLARVHQFAEKRKFRQLMKAFETALTKVQSLRGPSSSCNKDVSVTTDHQPIAKRKRRLTSELMNDWEKFSVELQRSERQVLAAENSFAFAFVEGAFVRAWKHGYWILLDELNLAPVETLERLTGVLEGDNETLNLTERGDALSIPRNPRFRVFACMNPPTDVGKHDLPMSLRTRFTEIYVDEEMGTEDLQLFVLQYLDGLMPNPPVASIVHFYQQAIQAAESQLYDSANQKPRYSLRSLARALEYTQIAMPLYGFVRALYDGVCMTFLTLLDRTSSVYMENLIQSQLIKNVGSVGKILLARAPRPLSSNHVEFEQFWLEKGSCNPSVSSVDFIQKYVLTKTVKEHLKHVAKAIFMRKYPVLLQGPTSSGKTSSIEYLAAITSHRFVRINNHEHTDLQEYLGRYVTNSHGKLIFQEGILVEAVRNGYWIVLDELNLAPSEVLEALNRLLDDNRELFIPELQLAVKPHPHFMLFATQNPPGLYGGRKVLSRAFRNRFIELHVDDIPENELCIILEQRCKIPRSYAEKMVAVMKDLQRNRQTSQAFAGKNGFITARDLFKWAERHQRSGMSYEDLARIGYILLAERLRDANESLTVRTCLEKNLRTKINMESLYGELFALSHMQEAKERLASKADKSSFGRVVWTKSMTRLYSLVEQCYQNKEPVLLIGETGCGKTTVCQLLSLIHERSLCILNCHQHTETADFLGGFRPVRDRESIAQHYEQVLAMIKTSKLFGRYHSGKIPHGIEFAVNTLSILHNIIQLAKGSGQLAEEEMDICDLEISLQKLESLKADYQSIFVWQDGPLVETMRRGDFFLVDEISLADDSVLERLNSVLEPKRVLVLAEKGSSNVEELVAHPNFFLMATMNPGGDFGKKELSPALRNRFTEIWVPPITEEDELRSIIHTRFLDGLRSILTDTLLQFWKWYQEQHNGRGLTVRDLLSWILFVNSMHKEIGKYSAFIHGAFLVLLDGISLGMGVPSESARSIRNQCLAFLLQQLPMGTQVIDEDVNENISMIRKEFLFFENKVGIHPFYIPKGPIEPREVAFELMAPTTNINTFRVLRAMQLRKPVLIEGSPGVGKTSLITALANITGHSLVRINLSEQTDMMDLLGSDLPEEGVEGITFRWSDGVFLQALKVGSWVMLDELNLASQSVLEGLNSCLDHRGDVYIPELGQSFTCHPTFRIFACQNPYVQGGGRKCLPRSFLDRFTKVYVDTLSEEDFLFISKSLHPSLSVDFLQKLIRFNSRILEDTMVARSYGHLGGPWEFNLRDVLRSCDLVAGSKERNFDFLEIIYLQRMRTARDRSCVMKVYEEIFGSPARLEAWPRVSLDRTWLQIGRAVLPRSGGQHFWSQKENLSFLPSQLKSMESLLFCVKHAWMSIIVGPAGSGKTSIVRLLAKLMGKPLQEFTLSTGTDTADLLGCFEQYDAVRCWKQLANEVHHLVERLFNQCLTTFDRKPSSSDLLSSLQRILAEWWNFEKLFSSRTQTRPVPYSKSSTEKMLPDFSEIDLLFQVVDQVKYVISMFSQSLMHEIKAIEKDLLTLRKTISRKGSMNQFEWVDGGFLKAVQRGDWVLLENANMCSPTVLDRLNPLVEPNGAILVNERGLTRNTATVLQAHPNFRLFLTVNPCHGEVSRAMRNRGVEIHLMQPQAWMDIVEGVVKKEEKMKSVLDCRQFLISAGIPSSLLVDEMCDAHVHVTKLMEPHGLNCSSHLRELRQWVNLFLDLLISGSSASESLQCSWEQIYMHGQEDSMERDAIMNLYHRHFPRMFSEAMVQSWSTLQLCGGWPSPLNVSLFCMMSIEAITLRDGMYLKHLLSEHAACQLRAAWCSGQTADVEATLSRWIQKREVAVLLPPPFFQIFLHPSSSKFSAFVEECSKDLTVFDRKVLFASFWIMRQIYSRSKREMRLVWLKWQADKIWPQSSSLNLFCKVLQLESEHPVYEQTMEALEQCEANVDNHLRLLDSFRRTLLQWQIEKDTLANFDLKASSITNSLMINSFKGYQDLLMDDLLGLEWTDPVQAIYPLFLFLRNLEEKMLLCGPAAWKRNICKTYLNFLDNHKQLFKVGCDLHWNSDIYSEWHWLYFCWKELRKGLVELMQVFFSQKVSATFIQIVWRIEKAFYAKRPLLKLYLWKHSGHPHIPTSKAAFLEHQALLNFCHSLWPFNVHGKENVKFFSINEVFRRLVLEGVGMALFVLQCQWKAGEDTYAQHNRESVARDILQKLHDRMNAQNIQMALPAGLSKVPGCECSPSHLMQDSCFREAVLKDCNQSSNSHILQWLDSLSLVQESSAVASVTQIASRLSSCGEQNVSSLKLVDAKERLLYVIDFALKFSSRSPLDLVPHQQILWLINESSVEGCFNRNMIQDFQSFSHQMRFNWYSAIFQREARNDLDPLSDGWDACSLLNASNSAKLSRMITEVVPLKHLHGKVQELRLGMVVLSSLKNEQLEQFTKIEFLHASSALYQLICSFAKSLEEDAAMEVSCLLEYLHGQSSESNSVEVEKKIQQLVLLLKKSTDKRFVTSVNTHIGFCLNWLYCQSVRERSSRDFLGFLSLFGKIWQHLGTTRLKLVLPDQEYDPAAKYSHQRTVLLERHDEAKLELQTREENDLVACRFMSEEENELQIKIQELEQEIQSISTKCVYRENSKTLRFLHNEINCFVKSMDGIEGVFSKLTALEAGSGTHLVHEVAKEIVQWQDISKKFIEGIILNYPDYRDLSQPVLLAVFEVKLGLTLLLAACHQKIFMQQQRQEYPRDLCELICGLIEFPKRNLLIDTARRKMMITNRVPALSFLSEGFLESSLATVGFQVQEKLIINLKVKLFHCAILHIRNSLLHGGLLSEQLRDVVCILMVSISAFWRFTQDIIDSRQTEELSLVKIKHRSHDLGLDADQDEGFFRSMFPEKSELTMGYREEVEVYMSDSIGKVDSEDKISEKEWKDNQCELGKDLNELLNLIFTLQLSPQMCGTTLSDEQRLSLFISAYDVGKTFLEGAGGFLPPSLNDRLISTHMLMLSLKEERLCSRKKEPENFNIYEDASPSQLAHLLSILKGLEHRITLLLGDWPNHPQLAQLMRGVDALFLLCVDAPLVKAVRGVEQLLSKAQLWEDNAPKSLSLQDILSSLQHLVFEWRKLEVKYWEVLLQKVESQFDRETDKLWFRLHGVLHSLTRIDCESDLEPLMSSLEEFMQTAAFGEYKTRLKMLSGFYAEYCIQKSVIELQSNAFCLQNAIGNLLFNLCGYYTQFLPSIENWIAITREDIAKELKDFLRLQKWDERNYYALTYSTEHTHKKLFKFVTKYKGLLGKPALVSVIDKNHLWASVAMAGSENGKNCRDDVAKAHVGHLEMADHENDTIFCYQCWMFAFQSRVETMSLACSDEEDKVVTVHGPNALVLRRFWVLLKDGGFSEGVVQARQGGTTILENLAATVISRSNELRAAEKQRMLKKKALVDLLKALHSMGFSHLRSAIPKEKRSPRAWILQDVCKVDLSLELLTRVSGNGLMNESCIASGHMQRVLHLWNKACIYYFRNLALVQQLRQLSSNFHKDLSSKEVAASISYMEHGLFIQQMQRNFAHKFALSLANLQSIAYEMCGVGSSKDVASVNWKSPLHEPQFERKWLWIQKSFIDSICNTYSETILLYKKAETTRKCSIENTHSRLDVGMERLETLGASLKACKENLDNVLVPGIKLFSVNDLEVSWPVLITPKSKQLILDNFATVLSAKASFQSMLTEADYKSPVLQVVWEQLCQVSKVFDDYNEQSKECYSTMKLEPSILRDEYETKRNHLVTEIFLSVQSLSSVSREISTDCLQSERCDYSGGRSSVIKESQRLQSWTLFIEEQINALRLEKVSEAVIATVHAGVKAFEGEDASEMGMLCKDLSTVFVILELLVGAGIAIFSDYVSLHKSLAKLSYILGNLFETLFQEGFCKSESQTEEEVSPKLEEASGTGLGEGQGKTDISNQIEDESQLLENFEKGLDENEKLEGKESSVGKGVEMTEDFEGDLMDISCSESDGSLDNDDDDDDTPIESKMGECGENENIVDENVHSKDDEVDSSRKGTEKYETGSSVQNSGSDLEYRAKETIADGPEEPPGNQSNIDQSWRDNKDCNEFEELTDDFGSILDENDAYEKPSGIDPSVPDTTEKNVEGHEADNTEDFPSSTDSDSMDTEDPEPNTVNDAYDTQDIDGNMSEEEGKGEQQGFSNMSVDGKIDDSGEVLEKGVEDRISDCKQGADENRNFEHCSYQESDNGLHQGVRWSTSLQASSDLLRASMNTLSMESLGLEEVPKEPVNQSTMSNDPEMGSSGAAGPTKQSMSYEGQGKEEKFRDLSRLDANPYRSLGDVLQQWKEQVTVRSESALETPSIQNVAEDLEIDALEYQYITEDTNSGPQALGSATADQMKENKVHMTDLEQNISREETSALHLNKIAQKKEENISITEDISLQGTQKHSIENVEDDDVKNQCSNNDVTLDFEMHEALSERGDSSIRDQSYVSMSLNQDAHANSAMAFSKLTSCNLEDALHIRKELECALSEGSWKGVKSHSLWAMYEQLTTRLSQELTEQLRLIMEPSLASRLEGDYRTGKQINLKKIIPYIASQFRKDKIWLRRTKPSKRQYQIVLAIDDSRSMSESYCGHIALEALLTICRSMSTLEVGQMAVVSFGQKGNVKILHDFDTPFTKEAGIQMISQFSFKQDNTIADEPMADLLSNVTLMLDVAAKKTSNAGRLHLRQLILIIADGRFHEKEKLRRCIREAVSRGQMLAFIVLDSSHESIMDVETVNFSGGAPTFSKYIDSFPFQNYILLKNIEELPLVLADLLRQWFEMVHRATLQ